MMATVSPSQGSTSDPARTGVDLLVMLAPMPAEQLAGTLANLAESMPGEGVLVAAPSGAALNSHSRLQTIPAPERMGPWTLAAADFINAHQIAQQNDARAILILGPESASLTPSALSVLASAVSGSPGDLVVPCYDLPSRTGLVNSAILYPITRALFASRIRFPLPLDLGMSLRMAERLGGAGQRFVNLNQNDALIWSIHEAAVAGFAVSEVDVGTRSLPQPQDSDLNAILALVTGSLFADVDAKAAFWQRQRPLPPQRISAAHSSAMETMPDVTSMVEAFRLAHTNLRDIWSLVLPPNSLLGLKRLSQLDTASFRMSENLWARIVFDFLVAYRLRTINRGHLLGALIPLYLAWVASHFNVVASGVDPERHIESVATAFEADKAYLVSRWRWPDRFNP